MPSRRTLLAAAAAGLLPAAARPGARAPLLPATELMLEPGLVHLQTGSVGASPRSVLDAMVAAWRRIESDPVRWSYREGAEAMEPVRAAAAALINAARHEIILTASTTMAMNMVADALALRPGDRVLLTTQQHPGGRLCWEWLARHRGVAIDTVPIHAHEDDPAALVARIEAAIGPATRVVSLSHILYTTGLRLPIADICRLAGSRGVISVVDGAQALGATPVDVRALGCDVYAASGHKWLLGPKGTGVLFVADRLGPRFEAMALQKGRGAFTDATGVQNLAGMAGLGAAVANIAGIGVGRVEAHNRALRVELAQSLAGLPGVVPLGSDHPALGSAMLAVSLPPDRDPRALRRTLADRDRILVRPFDEDGVRGIRVSPHITNGSDDIAALAAAMHRELG